MLVWLLRMRRTGVTVGGIFGVIQALTIFLKPIHY